MNTLIWNMPNHQNYAIKLEEKKTYVTGHEKLKYVKYGFALFFGSL